MNAASSRPHLSVFLRTNETGQYAVFKLATRLGDERFNAYRQATDGARYDGDERVNIASLDKALPILHRLNDASFYVAVDPELQEALKAHIAARSNLTASATLRADKIDAALKARDLALYPFQKTGVEWLAPRTGALLADEMGTGKTVQALAAMPEGAPILIVCPSVMKGTWIAEAAKWRPEITRTQVIQGRGKFRWPELGEMVVVNYDVLPDEFPVPHSNTTLLLDEVHALKNYKAKRTQRARALADAVRSHQGRTWALTATPIQNHPSELWSVLQAVGCAHEAFGSYAMFFQLMGGSTDRWGQIRWSPKPDASIPNRLRRVSLRREKRAVLSELPEKTFRTIECPIERATGKMLDKFWMEIQKSGVDLESAESLTRLSKGEGITLESVSKVRAAIATAKIPTMLEILEQYEESEEPVVVFSKHRAPVDVLAGRSGWATITGDNSKDAQEVAAKFQRGELKGVAATIQAGGVGITLTRAADLLLVDEDWTPSANQQAIDRIHRIGQTRGVVITRLVLDHSMDRHVSKVLSKKIAIIEKSVEASSVGVNFKPETLELLSEDQVRVAFAETVAERQQPEVIRRHAISSRDEWAAQGLALLSDADPDGAQELNEVGWSRIDGGVGHSLWESYKQYDGMLTDKQWELAAKICAKYWRQVGRSPSTTPIQEESK